MTKKAKGNRIKNSPQTNSKADKNAGSSLGGKLGSFNTSQSFSFLKGKFEGYKFRMAFGVVLISFSLFTFFSVLSYLFSARADQSVIASLNLFNLIDSGIAVKNWLGITGAVLANILIFRLFGIGSVLYIPLMFSYGLYLLSGRQIFNTVRSMKLFSFFLVWISMLVGYFSIVWSGNWGFLCGGLGYNLAFIFNSLFGGGSLIVLLASALIFGIYSLKSAPNGGFWKQTFMAQTQKASNDKNINSDAEDEFQAGVDENFVVKTPETSTELELYREPIRTVMGVEVSVEDKTDEPEASPRSMVPVENGQALDPNAFKEAIIEADNNAILVDVENFDDYDPKLDLQSYQYPSVDLLKDTGSAKVKVTEEELQANNSVIINTLQNFKIGISSIKATIGPTVTLYEIVPNEGIKISRIKNLEDDIALNLSAMGIRIIAPIPGKGTIGIEVPNKHRNLVSLKSVLMSERFVNSNYELPVALGRTISNDVFVTDLSKMPHLLMAGATGQGKSVGINVVLASLLFKKHPAELKFVLVDPKKVELSLFSKIERHFLAALPDAQEAIITDNRKAVGVLNSLCTEMDIRYNLLKEAGVRNLREYNDKFKKRRLNPNHGHRFLPYIVLVIDELADLMMVSGKEVEMPIARLAQLARAIGIHLVVATQRPSVDVITGIIKANFPARLSFKVAQKIDSRTILDANGADQLIGMGDMLLSNGSEIIRIQCAFIDTEEVENLCEFIGNQQGYDTAYLLPEAETEGEDGEDNKFDLSKRDTMFEEAAKLLVMTQQGSTSIIQRKLGLGYNRAGRIVDQLESAGIIGPHEGSKPRQVLISDPAHLEQILREIDRRYGRI
jgi:S-DNA-T family DNA segregation ATPase FtsK/SpoIIIE